MKIEWVEKLNPNLVLATYIKMNKVNWRVYETKDNPYVGAHLREVNLKAVAADRPEEADDGDYSPAMKARAHEIFLLKHISVKWYITFIMYRNIYNCICCTKTLSTLNTGRRRTTRIILYHGQ